MVFRKTICSSSLKSPLLESPPFDVLAEVFEKSSLDNLQKMVTFLDERLRLRQGDLFKIYPGELEGTPRFFVQVVRENETSTTEHAGSTTLAVADLQSTTSNSTEEIFHEIEDKHNEVAVAFAKKPFSLLRLSLFGVNLADKDIDLLNLASVVLHFYTFEKLRVSLFLDDEATNEKKEFLLRLLRKVIERK